MKKTLIGAAAFALSALAFAVPAHAATETIDGWAAEKVTVNVEDQTLVFADGGNLTKTLDTTKAAATDAVVQFAVTVSGDGACGAGAPRVIVRGFNLEGHVLPCTGGEPAAVHGINALTWYSWGGNTKYDSWADALATVDDNATAGLTGLIFDNNTDRIATVSNLTLFGDTIALPQPPPALTEVTPKVPTFTKPDCEKAADLVLPTEPKGVKYAAGTVTDGKVTVTATAEDSYKLPTTLEGWTATDGGLTITLDVPVGDKCPVGPAPVDKPVKIDGEPTIGKITCDKFEYTVPNTDQVNWAVDVVDVKNGVVTVKFTATAKDGFVIDGQHEWTKTFNVPANCTATPKPSTSTSPASGDQLPVTGPGGGTNVPLIAALAGVALIGFGGAGLAWARRRRDNVEFTA